MAIWSTRGNKDDYELVVNADELMGFELQQSAVQQLAQAIVRRIVERTRDGLDVDGRTQKPRYSDPYKQSVAFGATGKSETRVNLTLFGTLLNTLTVKQINGQEIIIGWNFEDESNKGHGHDTGQKGFAGRTLPQRQFLGLSPADERRFRREFANFRVDRRTTLSNLFESIFG